MNGVGPPMVNMGASIRIWPRVSAIRYQSKFWPHVQHGSAAGVPTS